MNEMLLDIFYAQLWIRSKLTLMRTKVAAILSIFATG